ncbi:ribonuclease H-like protein [Plenodomus tracheiphilus IPT5]|uniref:Ribonuclease H-like protein n=1 Tax=Plenodomus tracheiphilus IPT5 TaxID=1408161 RepID=A0A6A7AY51_9PLEO|nr:ribonuclease H-like protein [Plenodomus tracheiphilus IPT5]
MPPRIPKPPKVPKSPKPPSITAKALQTLLTRIGSASSGTKTTLNSRLLRDISVSRLRNCHATWDAQRTMERNRKLRIVSIDMGIKNLAFCDAEVSYPGQKQSKDAKAGWNAIMDVIRWEKIDLVANTRDLQRQSPQLDSKASNKKKKKSAVDEEEDEELDPYSLSVLSETAYRLIKNTILANAPDIILIERQRWRSGGGSAVQQWTVRVNTLEGMLWAVLATLRAERVHMQESYREKHPHAMKEYDVYAVDPKRVGNYWLQQDAQVVEVNDGKAISKKSKARKDRGEDETAEEQPEVETKKKLTRSKAEKKAKINILRSWLSSNTRSTASTTSITTPTITFKLGASAERIRQALCSPTKSIRRSKKTKSGDDSVDSVEDGVVVEAELKKLDDVTDCLLQAAAWVSWESNRLQMEGVKQRYEVRAGSVSEGDDGVLLEMVREIEGG